MAKLDRFFVFNPELCSKEGQEDKKILYYYPKSRDLNSQIKDVGLVEALVNFSRTFGTASTAVHGIQTLKSRQVFLEPEPGYFIVMIISLVACDDLSSTTGETGRPESAVADECAENAAAAPCVSQLDSELSLEMVNRSHLERVYRLYRMLHGPLAGQTTDTLVGQLTSFFDACLPLLCLDDCDILRLLGGVQFVPLPKHVYMQLVCLANRVQNVFPQLLQLLIYYDNRLIWCGVSLDNLCVVHHYLSTVLFPDSDISSSSSSTAAAGHSESDATSGATGGVFMSTEAANPRLCSSKDTLAPPLVRLTKHKFDLSPQDGSVGRGDKEVLLKMVLYRYDKFVFALFVDANFETSMAWCSSLDQWLCQRLGPLLPLVQQSQRCHDNQTNTAAADVGFGTANEVFENTKCLYFNARNLALQTSLHEVKGHRLVSCLPREVNDLLPALRYDLSRLLEPDADSGGQIGAKLSRDVWVAVRVTTTRQLYMVGHSRQASLIDMYENLDHLCSTQFGEVFLPP